MVSGCWSYVGLVWLYIGPVSGHMLVGYVSGCAAGAANPINRSYGWSYEKNGVETLGWSYSSCGCAAD